MNTQLAPNDHVRIEARRLVQNLFRDQIDRDKPLVEISIEDLIETCAVAIARGKYGESLEVNPQ